MTHPIIERRLAEQREKIGVADSYVRAIAARIGIEKAWVVGSVARGDFNVWSDIDVVLIAEQLPLESLRRGDLFLDKPPGVEVIAYTSEEFDNELARRNPLIIEATTIGVPVGPGTSSPNERSKKS